MWQCSNGSAEAGSDFHRTGSDAERRIGFPQAHQAVGTIKRRRGAYG
jgi:hypothetical protein